MSKAKKKLKQLQYRELYRQLGFPDAQHIDPNTAEALWVLHKAVQPIRDNLWEAMWAGAIVTGLLKPLKRKATTPEGRRMFVQMLREQIDEMLKGA